MLFRSSLANLLLVTITHGLSLCYFVMKGSGSPSAAHLSQRVTRSPFMKSPLVRSPGANKLGSSLGVLAEAAASKSERSPSAGGKPSVRSPSAGAKPSVRSPSLPGSPSPSPKSSPVGGSRTVRRGELTFDVHLGHFKLQCSYKCYVLPLDRKSTRLNSSHSGESRMPSSA